MTTKNSVKIADNLSADKYNEFNKMVSIHVSDKGLLLTDFIFNSDRTLKFIKSELDKDELKMLMLKLIDEHYDQYK